MNRPVLYADFFGFAEEPFDVTPDPRFLFLDTGYQEALAHLEYGVLYGKGFVLLTGEVGTGKTTLLNALMDRLPEEFGTAFVFSTAMSFVELLEMIHDDFRTGAAGGSESSLLIQLYKFLVHEYGKGRSSVLILDEAQNLEVGLLEKIRLLSNLEARTSKLLQIVLSGQPELVDKLERTELRQLNQRIAIRYPLAPLSRSDTNRYIDHRLAVARSQGRVSFTDEAVDLVYAHSRGIPRVVNVLCGNALLLGFGVGKREIDGVLLREVIADLTRRPPRVLAAGAPVPGGPGGAILDEGKVPVSPGGRPWTAEEAAAYLRVSVPVVRKMFRRGEIAARRVGRGWRVHRETLDRFVCRESGELETIL